MVGLKVFLIVIIIGEGGLGGVLVIVMGDFVIML